MSYRRHRPSARKRMNRDSSVKKTRLHCLTGKHLGACAVTQAIRRTRRARLSGKPALGRQARKTKLAQPIPYGFQTNTAIMTAYRIYRRFCGREVTIKQMGKMNGSVLALRRHARTSRSWLVCDPSSFPQTSEKTFYRGFFVLYCIVVLRPR